MTTATPMTVTPVTGALGAVIEGVHPCDPDLDFAAVHRAFLDHEVIFFPGADLTEEQHLEFGRRFGTPSIFPLAKLRGATEPTMTVITDAPGQRNAADAWHTDVTWSATPPKAALLQAMQVPERGGDTLWCSATAAFDALSPHFQALLVGLTAQHDGERFFRQMWHDADDATERIAGFRRAFPPVEHPVVRTHPDTGKRALMYAAMFMVGIVDLAPAESDAVIRFIDDHVKDPAFHCRWKWSEGDLAVWDERSTLHRAAADHFPFGRSIRRLEIDGDRPYR